MKAVFCITILVTIDLYESPLSCSQSNREASNGAPEKFRSLDINSYIIYKSISVEIKCFMWIDLDN